MEPIVTTSTLKIEVYKGKSGIFNKPIILDNFIDEETALKYINKYYKVVKVDRFKDSTSAINNGDEYLTIVQNEGQCTATNLGFYKILK